MSNNEQDPASNKSGHLNRRGFLKATFGTVAGAYALGAGSGFGLFTPAHAAKQAIGNYPIKGDKVVYGFAPPLTGAYAEEGKDEMRAFKLAVDHINNGGGILDTMKPAALKGNGVLGKKVTYVTGDSQTDPDAARAVGRRMIERDNVIMFAGGSSSAVAIAQEDLGQEKGVIFMVGLSGSNATTGKDRRRYGFRHFSPAYMSAKALGPIIAKDYGSDRRAFHLSADYTWGHSQQKSMQRFTEKEGWTTVKNIYTPLGNKDYSQYLTAFLNSDADVLVLNEYGNDMVNSLTQAVRFGIDKLKKNGKDVKIVVPLFSRLMATGAGDAIKGVYGTASWNYKLTDPGSQAFTKTFQAKYGFPPSTAAQTCYVQTIMYSDAAQRAGSFYPPDVIKALEDYTVTDVGPGGKTIYRGCDHQAFHNMVVVQGKGPDERENEFDMFKLVEEVQREDITYDCDQFPGELGPYIPT